MSCICSVQCIMSVSLWWLTDTKGGAVRNSHWEAHRHHGRLWHWSRSGEMHAYNCRLFYIKPDAHSVPQSVNVPSQTIFGRCSRFLWSDLWEWHISTGVSVGSAACLIIYCSLQHGPLRANIQPRFYLILSNICSKSCVASVRVWLISQCCQSWPNPQMYIIQFGVDDMTEIS